MAQMAGLVCRCSIRTNYGRGGNRPVAERYWPQSGQACRINLRRVACKGRHRASGKEAVTTLAVCARREEISRGMVSGLSLRRSQPNSAGRRQRLAGRSNGITAAQSIGRPMLTSVLGGRPVILDCVGSLSIDPCRWWWRRKKNDNWSPQQIGGWLKVEYVDEEPMRVSHETIYKSLFVQARGVLRKELISRLRTRRLMRRGKSSTTRGQPRGQIVDAVSIGQRPAEVEDRAIPGHWEGDPPRRRKEQPHRYLGRASSRFVILVQVPGKDTDSVVSALVRKVKHLPAGLMSSLTGDRGTELADHKRFTVATAVTVYFCDPQSQW